MPYASENRISQDPIPSGVKISASQYAKALEGLLDGKHVTIVGGFKVIDAPEPEQEPQEPTPVDPDAPYMLYKSTLIRRLTSEEAGAVEKMLTGVDAKLRLLFNSDGYFVSNDPLFFELKDALAAALGKDRAEALLASQET